MFTACCCATCQWSKIRRCHRVSRLLGPRGCGSTVCRSVYSMLLRDRERARLPAALHDEESLSAAQAPLAPQPLRAAAPLRRPAVCIHAGRYHRLLGHKLEAGLRSCGRGQRADTEACSVEWLLSAQSAGYYCPATPAQRQKRHYQSSIPLPSARSSQYRV